MFLGSTLLLLLKVKPSFRRINFGIFALFISMLVMGIVPARQIILLTLIIFFIGLSVSYVDVQFMSLLQIIIPAEIQGRVFSSVFTMMKSSVPVGVIALGFLADATSIQLVFIAVPFMAIIISILLLLVTGIRKMDEKFHIGKFEQKESQEQIVPALL